MENRIDKVTTRNGDKGQTTIGDGTAVSKSHPRLEAMGTIDELNSSIGLIRAHCSDEKIDAILHEIQHDLFDLGGELCMPGNSMMKEEQVLWLDQQLEGLNAEHPPLKEFILPGGSKAAAFTHISRTICRRAERILVHFGESEELYPQSLKYINRLSDLLFVLARSLNKAEGLNDVLWNRKRS